MVVHFRCRISAVASRHGFATFTNLILTNTLGEFEARNSNEDL
jgi:hypothetical protein